MVGGNAIRGTRVGAGPSGESERGEAAPRRRISYWCANRHESRPSFATDAEIPDEWECPRCGLPAGRDEQNPPAAPRTEPYKSHLAYVKERRSDADGERILAEALERLRRRREI
ncbi:RNA polymerase-binding protein RbpA [Saccharomonospora saliphila]|uniref:RNA polymerase-binding protein RbpA n=1 Tax=Saccharomonospora saliphila TaxID=369829 RepID=UPI000491601E|nr:RNA polymerase-binding protein RbpA [Saccharomonospora saliphila]